MRYRRGRRRRIGFRRGRRMRSRIRRRALRIGYRM